MNKIIAAIALALMLSLTAHPAICGERGGDAALGALSGAVVLGPVGAVAGALVGYTAGPSIAQAWGLRRSGGAPQASRSANRQGARVSRGEAQLAQGAQTREPAAAQAPTRSTASVAPPVQTPARSTASVAPPVQTLE